MASDGASLMTMLQLSAGYETMVMIFLNSSGDIFGGLVTSPWKNGLGHSFYGESTCNVWTFHQGEELHMYPGTGANEYYLLVSEQCFAMGSGGNFAIYLVLFEIRMY
jgi:hypothetical protein